MEFIITENPLAINANTIEFTSGILPKIKKTPKPTQNPEHIIQDNNFPSGLILTNE